MVASFHLLGATAFPADSKAFEGIYSGGMNLFGKATPIPLRVSLVLTNEYVQIPIGNGVLEQQQVIDAAFIIDDEGGPYGFYKVSYNLEKSLIDLRYNRPTVTTTMVSIPSSFRLIGKVQEGGLISGKVISGQNGPIGTFKISRNNVNQDIMMTVTKYAGNWVGTASLLPDNRTIPFTLGVEKSSLANVNPADYELDFTPGKLGHYRWMGIDFNINKVFVDYLRQKMFLIETNGDTGTAVSLECDLSSVSRNQMTGTIFSMNRGKRGTFQVTRDVAN